MGRGSTLLRDLRRLSSSPVAARRAGVAFAEGIHLALEALDRRPAPVRVLLSPRLARTGDGKRLIDRLRREPGRMEILATDDATLGRLSHVETHQGILLVVPRPVHRIEAMLEERPLILAACGIQDPGNLGALGRITEAAWGSGLLCLERCADPFSPRALRASAGALLRLPVVESDDPLGAAKDLAARGVRLVGTSPHASRSYLGAELAGPVALFVGGEGAGLAAGLLESMDEIVRIPMREGVESLNVAAAAAVLLFAAAGAGA